MSRALCLGEIVVQAPDDAADDVGREAAARQEAGLPGAFRGVLGRVAEAAAPDVVGALKFGALDAGQRGGGFFRRHPAGAQGLAQFQAAESPRLGRDQCLGRALLAEQALFGEFVECAGDAVGGEVFRRVLDVARQLTLELGAGVFALRQVAQRPPLDRPCGQGAYSAELAAEGGATGRMPRDSRTLFSISRAISGFSRRNSRALSFPWPIFSPL